MKKISIILSFLSLVFLVWCSTSNNKWEVNIKPTNDVLVNSDSWSNLMDSKYWEKTREELKEKYNFTFNNLKLNDGKEIYQPNHWEIEKKFPNKSNLVYQFLYWKINGIKPFMMDYDNWTKVFFNEDYTIKEIQKTTYKKETKFIKNNELTNSWNSLSWNINNSNSWSNVELQVVDKVNVDKSLNGKDFLDWVNWKK